MSQYKYKYWNTLIHLECAEDKDKLKHVCMIIGVPPSKLIGSMISRFIKQQQEKVKDE